MVRHTRYWLDGAKHGERPKQPLLVSPHAGRNNPPEGLGLKGIEVQGRKVFFRLPADGNGTGEGLDVDALFGILNQPAAA